MGGGASNPHRVSRNSGQPTPQLRFSLCHLYLIRVVVLCLAHRARGAPDPNHSSRLRLTLTLNPNHRIGHRVGQLAPLLYSLFFLAPQLQLQPPASQASNHAIQTPPRLQPKHSRSTLNPNPNPELLASCPGGVTVVGLYTILPLPMLCVVYIAITGGRGETMYCAIVWATMVRGRRYTKGGCAKE